MFNKRLKQELSALREELSSLQQVRDSLESEMLVLTLDAEGRIHSVNQNFIDEMLQEQRPDRAAHRGHRSGSCEIR